MEFGGDGARSGRKAIEPEERLNQVLIHVRAWCEAHIHGFNVIPPGVPLGAQYERQAGPGDLLFGELQELVTECERLEHERAGLTLRLIDYRHANKELERANERLRAEILELRKHDGAVETVCLPPIGYEGGI